MLKNYIPFNLSDLLYLLFFFFLIFGIYFFSRRVFQEIFYLLKKIVKKDSIAYLLISIVFFPGTIIHELAHYFCAIILFLNVGEIVIFPSWEKNRLVFGHVTFEKKDPIRGLMVGVAPFFFGLFFLFLLDKVALPFLAKLYLIFVVSTMMFSSGADLKELVSVIPFFLIGAALFLIFKIQIDLPVAQVIGLIENISFYLVISFIINVSLWVILKAIKNIYVISSRR